MSVLCFVFLYVSLYRCIYMCAYVCVYDACMTVSVYVSVCVFMSAYIYMCVYVYVCVCLCVIICVVLVAHTHLQTTLSHPNFPFLSLISIFLSSSSSFGSLSSPLPFLSFLLVQRPLRDSVRFRRHHGPSPERQPKEHSRRGKICPAPEDVSGGGSAPLKSPSACGGTY